MAWRRNRGLSPDQRHELWRRWREGQTLTEIAEALGKQPGSVFGTIRASGGYSPRDRTRSEHHLTRSDREEITQGLAAGDSLRAIASRLGRSPSTVSREVSRNGGRERYRSGDSDDAAWARARRPKACVLAKRPRLRSEVAQKLSEDWSPQQISGWLREEFADAGVTRDDLLERLRPGARRAEEGAGVPSVVRAPLPRLKHATTKGQGRGTIRDAVSIRERPAEAEDRAVSGHWEGDLLAGSGNTHIATLVERRSRFTILVKVDSKDTQKVVRALQRRVRTLPKQLRRTLTWDRGLEMEPHRDFTVATNVKVYFCDPPSPWQRGTNENTNLLLRKYFPKGTDLSVHTQAHLDRIARTLKGRPRQTLGFKTPAHIIGRTVAMTD